MKKILVDAYTNLNFGDDLFLKILFDKYPNVKWILDIKDKTYKDIYKNYNNVKVKSFLFEFKKKVKRKLKIKEGKNIFNKYDALVFIGGSIFMQNQGWQYRLNSRKILIKSFIEKKAPFFVIGSNFGPYEDKVFLNEYKEILSKAEDVCFRDTYSYEKFKEYKNIRVEPDIVFQLKPKNIEKKKKSIGISLIELKDREDLSEYREIYIKKIKDIIEAGVSRGYNFTLFSFCERQGDLQIINDVVNLINNKYKKQISIVNYNGNIEEFLVKFESMENIIGTRFHACILSQVFSQGLYPIIYSDKTYNVLKDIGLYKEYTYIRDLDKLDVNYLIDVISSNKLKDSSIFKKAEKQFEGLDSYFKRN